MDIDLHLVYTEFRSGQLMIQWSTWCDEYGYTEHEELVTPTVPDEEYAPTLSHSMVIPESVRDEVDKRLQNGEIDWCAYEKRYNQEIRD